MNGIGKILPVEGYIAELGGDLPVNYATSLSHLYQPLIGPYAVTLYQTLLDEVELQQGNPQTHHTLMNYMNLALDDIYYTRLRLEGIGLLKTYEAEMKQHKVYIYELQCPFAPKDFFLDAMLSQLLYHHIGEKTYKKLEVRFCEKESHKSLKNVTASFHDVYKTHKSFAQNVTLREDKEPKTSPSVEKIDFTWIEQILRGQMIPFRNVLTGPNKRLIMQMMELYDLEDYEIEKSLLWALNEENNLNTVEFKEACHDLFRTKEQSSQIQLTDKRDTTPHTYADYRPTSKEEQLIDNFEKSSPKEVLEDFSQGNNASSQDMKVIRDVMTTQGLSKPVMNVLIHYVLLQSNMKLSKPYLETIASHWSRANLATAKEAMAFAKSQKDALGKAKQRKAQKQKQKGVSKEVIPDWFQAQEDAKKHAKKEHSSLKVDEEKEMSEVAKLLEEFTTNK